MIQNNRFIIINYSNSHSLNKVNSASLTLILFQIIFTYNNFAIISIFTRINQ
jgi:hypothetical protein